ncbi:MAG: DUF3313 domain-containing protein [Planctomycetota bacterium]|jgi:hypothetical protein
MRKTTLLIILAVGLMAIQCGCTTKKAKTTGFLSDYSKLRAQSDVSALYIAPGKTLRNYSKFIIEPVAIHFHTGSKAIEQRSKGEIKEEDLTDLRNYMHDALVEAIKDRYEVVYRSGPSVARLRAAITDLKKSGVVQNVLLIGRAVGSGLGGASIEAELLDSQTGEQIGVIVESQIGEGLSLDGYSAWGDAKSIMDRWAKRFRQRIDEAHGQ